MNVALRPTLSATTLERLPASTPVLRPTYAHHALPERAIQFGTGALLRGLVDACVDAANMRGQFNGRIVAIGFTGSGRDRAFTTQDGLFTLVARGVAQGERREDRRIIASVSRALSAQDQWHEVLDCARNPDLRVIFSNTTEVGLAVDSDDRFDDAPPRSFPAKLTRFLHERAVTMDFATDAGVVVIPCELVEANGDTLQRLVVDTAVRWNLDARFLDWLSAAVPFCNTLVDRIVPGAPTGDDATTLADALGYDDALLTTAEHFLQFVIEGDDQLTARLGFADVDGVMIVPDVTPYRLRKVGLLNGAHTLGVTTALLCGCVTVRDAMQHPQVGAFIRRAVLKDMVPTFEVPEAESFAKSVLTRFENPFIRHALIDITLHGTTKFRVRLVPTLQRAAARWGHVPESLAFGLAAHLWYLRGEVQERRHREGLPVPPDVLGDRLRAMWSAAPTSAGDSALPALVSRMLSDDSIWGTDLTALPQLTASVTHHLQAIQQHGAASALQAMLNMEAA